MNKALIYKEEEIYHDDVKQEVARQQSALEANHIDAMPFHRSHNGESSAVTAFNIRRRSQRLMQCRSIVDSAYFGRINFIPHDTATVDNLYIGKFPLYDGVSSDFLIIEWQAPISALYYQNHAIGRTGYRCPDGLIEGNITLRREFKIQNGVLSKVVDASDGAVGQDGFFGDSLLQEWLERNAEGQMGEVVRSIQAEQDTIIRSRAKIVIIQGPAGSGKTVVALHRAAYLLYDTRKRMNGEDITASSVLTFSPNKIFESYIANVLPELGEDSVEQTFIDDEIRNDVDRRIKDARAKFGQLRDLVSHRTREENAVKWGSPLQTSDHIIDDVILNSVRFEKALVDEVAFYREGDVKGESGEKTGKKKKIEYRKYSSYQLPSDVFTRLISERRNSSGLKMERKEDFYRNVLNDYTLTNRNLRLTGARLKSSAVMLRAIEAYANAVSDEFITLLGEETFAGAHRGVLQIAKKIAGKDFQQQAYSQAAKKYASPLERLKAVGSAIEQEIQYLRKRPTITPLTIQAIQCELDRLHHTVLIWEARNPIDFYRSLWLNPTLFAAVERHPSEEAQIQEIASDTIATLDSNKVQYEDLLPIALLSGLCCGFSSFGPYRHAIVDEAQDYSPLHYAYMQKRLPDDCYLTVAGDINQSMNHATGLKDYTELTEILDRTPEFVHLHHNYRSTQEIVEFARHALRDVPDVRCIRASGRKPKVIRLSPGNKGDEELFCCIKFMREAGYQTVAALTQTHSIADSLHKRMPADVNARLLTEDSDSLGCGVFVLPVYLAKGLEYDAVLLYDLQQTDDEETSRRLLYTACTRALHELIIFYKDSPPPFLPLGETNLYEVHSPWLQVVSLNDSVMR